MCESFLGLPELDFLLPRVSVVYFLPISPKETVSRCWVPTVFRIIKSGGSRWPGREWPYNKYQRSSYINCVYMVYRMTDISREIREEIRGVMVRHMFDKKPNILLGKYFLIPLGSYTCLKFLFFFLLECL